MNKKTHLLISNFIVIAIFIGTMIFQTSDVRGAIYAQGYIKDSTTQSGINNVNVVIYGLYLYNDMLKTFSRGGYTDANGYYNILLPSTTLSYNKIVASKTGYVTYNGAYVSEIYLSVTPSEATISGYVYAASHGYQGLSGVTVKAYDTNNNVIGSAFSDSNGNYQLTTTPFVGTKTIILRATYLRYDGYYGTTNWITPSVETISITAGCSYTEYFYVYDAEETKEITYELFYSTATHYYLTIQWVNYFNPFDNTCAVKIKSWMATCYSITPLSLDLTLRLWTGVPGHSDYVYSYHGIFYPQWVGSSFYYETLSDTLNIFDEGYMYLTSWGNYANWNKVVWDSYHGTYSAFPVIWAIYIGY